MAARRAAVAALARFLPPSQTVRQSSYRSSPLVEDVRPTTEYSRFERPAEWRHVENVIFGTAPPSPVARPHYPSGWKPADPAALEHPSYYVPRTRNHMPRVYLKTSFKGQRRITQVSGVRGDVWLLRDRIQEFLQTKHERIIAARVHEMCGRIEVKGDYYYDVRDFILKEGF